MRGPRGMNQRCQWCVAGKPMWVLSGKEDVKWYDPLCPKCRQRLVEGKTVATAPTPKELYQQHLDKIQAMKKSAHGSRGWVHVELNNVARRRKAARRMIFSSLGEL